MKKILILIIIIIFIVVMLSSEVEKIVNPDKPLKGQWHLKPREVWAITAAGSDTLSRPEFVAAADGTLCVWDWKNKSSYIFDNQGKFKKAFGKRGEGPGEMRYHFKSFFIEDKLITVDLFRLHYFTRDGEFLKSVPYLFVQQEPHFFLNENEFIAAPTLRLPEGKGDITHVNLKTGQKKRVKEFEVLKRGELREGPQFNLVGLSPSIVMGYDDANSRIYYGINHSYTIHAVDLSGNLVNTFSVRREKKKIPLEAKIKELKMVDPSGPAKEIAKHLPDEIVYFFRIQIVNGLIYVFTGNFGVYWENQSIDIFSPGGQYLYRTQFKPDDELHIYFSAHGIRINNDHLYVILEDDEGEVSIVKYKISLPSTD